MNIFLWVMAWYLSGLVFMTALQMGFDRKITYKDAAGIVKISVLGLFLIVIVPIIAIIESDWWKDKSDWWNKHKDDVFWRI